VAILAQSFMQMKAYVCTNHRPCGKQKLNSLFKDCLQVQSRSEAVGIGTLTYGCRRHTIQPWTLILIGN
jgi:hypothetical protein